jgi:peptide/nickel transport system substrate-binding protein
MSGSSFRKHLSRREFLTLGTASAAVILSQACAPQAPAANSAAAPVAAPTQAAPAVATPTSAAQVPAVNVGLAAPTAAPTPAAPAAPAAAKPAAPAGVKRGGTLTVAKPTPMREFDPFQVGPGHYTWMRAFWNTPVRYDAQLNPVPELAESWEFSPDNLEMTLHLRRGVKFHSGREFNSSDAKASVDFASNDKLASLQGMYQTIKEVATPDPYTAVLKFAAVQPGIFDMLDGLYIIDKETIDQRSKTAVGTGPFKLDKYTPNDSVETVAFADYWEKGKPYIE